MTDQSNTETAIANSAAGLGSAAMTVVSVGLLLAAFAAVAYGVVSLVASLLFGVELPNPLTLLAEVLSPTS